MSFYTALSVPRPTRMRLLPSIGIVAGLVCLMAIFAGLAFLLPNFATLGNATNILDQFGPLALLALGQMCVILIRGYDISVGAVMAIASVVAAMAIGIFGIAGVLAAPVVGAIFGCMNGVLVGRLKVQPVVATLGTMLLARSLALIVSDGGQAVVVDGDAQMQLMDFNFGSLAGVPYGAILTAIVFLAVAWALRTRRAGRRLFMVGGDPDAARLVGVSIERTTVLAYAMCGVCAGLAAALILARTGAGLPTDGFGMELQAIATAVIGGTPLTGGFANPVGVFIAALIIQTTYSGLSFSAISPYAGECILGVVILIAGVMGRWRH